MLLDNKEFFKKRTMSKKIFNLIFVISAVFLIISATSCDPSKKYEEDERNAITAYLLDNPTLQYERKPSGLYYLEVLEGTGPIAVKNDTAWVKIKVMDLNGNVYGTGADTLGFLVDTGSWIKGFDEAITYMKQGGKSQALIPSSLAWGPSGDPYRNIPGYTPFLFDIELFKLIQGPTE
jgi:FKBP-type peptidyl-prolyl cis-trans isomerase